jgi:hypothetical protein
MKRLFLPLCFLMYVPFVAHSLAQAAKESCDIPLVVTRFVPSSRTVEVVKDLGVKDLNVQLGTSFVAVESASVDRGSKRLALILDASPSVPENEWKLETEMAVALVQHGRPEDKFFVSFVGSDSSPGVSLSPSEAVERLRKAASSRPARVEPGERVYDALFAAIGRMSPAEFGDALFLFGHPEDSGSNTDPDQVMDLILKSRLRFYGISFSDPLSGKLPSGFNPNQHLPANLGPTKLAKMSAATGYYFSFHSIDSLNGPGQMRLFEGFLSNLYAGVAEPYRLRLPASDLHGQTKVNIVVNSLEERNIVERDIHFPRLIYPCSLTATQQ